ncbi:Cytidine deaminase [Echinococcus granulosus]|uniref:Cytidine deaminase n=1 Tax=Echinococcus granulosus TaxID=6210 RepID=U6JHM5_ECHGR|nr:Cytidine deaminase [Echinococcus granulosus]EUB55545.1 Cytidine deaminase [Echinococcus granulosus]KAH9285424.1 Cytidine deaminase [Echinococcus granulosus]CDS23599.1 cytidine deaminase [Echinococcus granulosus]
MASTLTPEMNKVRKTALSLLERAYCPYSGFPVGAALIDPEGRIFTGVNVEIASFPCGWCAEVSAFGAALTAGVKDFVAMAVAVDRDEFASPCGRCRQVVCEFCYGKNMPLLLVNRKGEYHLTKIEELHAMAFLQKNLDKK